MKYFIDTEFSERGNKYPIELISIGIISEDGREFYAHSAEYDAANCNDWVKENVLKYLQNKLPMNLYSIKESIKTFIGNDKPEFWGYYSDYDWVVFCQIFGTMIDLPKNFPMYCNDLKQLCKSVGNPQLPKQISGEHNALNDAKWNKKIYKFLIDYLAVRVE